LAELSDEPGDVGGGHVFAKCVSLVGSVHERVQQDGAAAGGASHLGGDRQSSGKWAEHTPRRTGRQLGAIS
jgi:hypothetical protein